MPDARLAFHMQRLTASACKFTHLARMMPPELLRPLAVRFDALQRAAFATMNFMLNFVPLDDRSALQVSLPFRHGGLGLTSLSFISHAAYVASRLDTASLLARWLFCAGSDENPTVATLEESLVNGQDELVSTIEPRLAPLPNMPDNSARTLLQHPTHT